MGIIAEKGHNTCKRHNTCIYRKHLQIVAFVCVVTLLGHRMLLKMKLPYLNIQVIIYEYFSF